MFKVSISKTMQLTGGRFRFGTNYDAVQKVIGRSTIASQITCDALGACYHNF